MDSKIFNYSNLDSSTIGKVSCKLFPFTLLNYSFFIFGGEPHKEELHTYATLHVGWICMDL